MCMDVEEAIFICSSISIRDNNVGGLGWGWCVPDCFSFSSQHIIICPFVLNG